MEDKRGQTIFLSVVGVATLLVAIVGATFAYFSITVEQNDVTSVLVRTATLTNITFTDGAQVNTMELYPGGYVTKTFNITADSSATGGTLENATPTNYQIVFTVDGTTTLDNNLNTAGRLDELQHWFVGGEGVETGTPLTAGTVAELAEGTAMTNEVDQTRVLVGGQATIYPGAIHTYQYRIGLDETGSEQNYAQGSLLKGELSVEASSEDNWTTGDGGSGSARHTP